MVKPPVSTILLVGDHSTGKTTYVQRMMGLRFDEIVERGFHNREVQETTDVFHLHYVPVYADGNSAVDGDTGNGDVIRIIEMIGTNPIPPEYIGLIHNIIVFASFDDEYSIYDITFHTNRYTYLGIPIHAIINKKDLLENLSPDIIDNATMVIDANRVLASVRFISCKTDENMGNLRYG